MLWAIEAVTSMSQWQLAMFNAQIHLCYPCTYTSGHTEEIFTWRPSLLHRPLLVFVGAMVTTGGVFGTVWPAGGTRTGPGPRGPLLGVLTGEL